MSNFAVNTVIDMAEIYLAGGCFWGTEHFMKRLSGVLSTQVGYANGQTESPTYNEVCHCNTGHAETVRVEFDPQQVRLEVLLRWFFKTIDPTSVNRQGGDVGTQYRTGIYYTDATHLPVVEAAMADLAQRYTKPLAVEVKPLLNFYPAEDYHQQYLEKNPGGYCHISPELFAMARNAANE